MIWLWSIKFKEGKNAKNNPCGLGGGGQLFEKNSMNEKLRLHRASAGLPDAVEYIYKDKKECYKERHPTGDHLGLDEEADPAGHHEHEAGQVNLPDSTSWWAG